MVKENLSTLVNPFESRTEEIQARLRSERIMTRIEGCRPGSTIPAVMEPSDKISNGSERIEHIARYWAAIHRGWLGPLAASHFDDELD